MLPFSTTSTARLQALYSDFSRQKQSNPTSYHANVDWWKKALEALVSSGKQEFQNHLQKEVLDDDDDDLPMKSERLVLHAGRDLIERLKIPKVGKPLALGAVLVRFFFLLSLSPPPPRFLIIILFFNMN
jgi:charged multivesicular body protein 7